MWSKTFKLFWAWPEAGQNERTLPLLCTTAIIQGLQRVWYRNKSCNLSLQHPRTYRRMSKRRNKRSVEIDGILPSTAQTALPIWCRQTHCLTTCTLINRVVGAYSTRGQIQAFPQPGCSSTSSSPSTSPAKSKSRLTQADGQDTEVSPALLHNPEDMALQNFIAALPTTSQPVLDTTLRDMLLTL